MYSAFHYSMFISIWKEKSIMLIELFKLIIFLEDCYYLCTIASNLLQNREHVVCLQRVIFGFSFVIGIGFSIYIFILKSENKNFKKEIIISSKLCAEPLF